MWVVVIVVIVLDFKPMFVSFFGSPWFFLGLCWVNGSGLPSWLLGVVVTCDLARL